MKYRYLIWDFDGTLFDTYPPMAEAMHRALLSWGITVSNGEIQALMKKSMQYAFDYVADKYDLKEHNLGDRYRDAYDSLGMDAVRPFAQIPELLTQIIARDGMNLIFTHRGQSVFKYLEHYHLDSCFQEVLSVGGEIARKPAPDGFLYLMKKHRLEGTATLGVGDRAIDILSAKNAGIATCLFTGGEEMDNIGGVVPDYCITEYAQLMDLLKLR